jgi:hypothetical protein
LLLVAAVRQLDEAVALSSVGSVEELALVVAQHAGASQSKLRAVTGLPQVVLDGLLSSAQFRRRVTESLTLLRVSPGVEARILDRFVSTAVSEESSFRDFRESADWLLQQGGVKRAERSEIEVGGRVRVEFVVDQPELDGAGYSPPNPLAGVVGVRPRLGEGDVIDVEHALVGVPEAGS